MPNLHDAAFWTGCADYRARANDFTSRYAADAWHLAKIPAGASVLDVAAGAGALTAVAAAHGHAVLAVDFATGMVEAVEALGLDRVSARVMDGQALALDDATFDAAFSMFGVMLFPDWERGLRELARVVKSGGVVCIGTWADPAGAAMNLLAARLGERLFPDVNPPTAAPGLAPLSTEDGVRRALECVGLRDIAVAKVTHDFTVSMDDLDDPSRLFQFSPWWTALDEVGRDRLVGAARDSFAPDTERLDIPSTALIATARRP
jgi:SAM-dependent methyltransferase